MFLYGLGKKICVNVSLGKENFVWKHFGRITYVSRCSLVF